MQFKNIIRAILVGAAFFCVAFSALPASAATSNHNLQRAVYDDDAAPPADPAPAEPVADPAPDPAPDTQSN
jgi:hypothetical protein